MAYPRCVSEMTVVAFIDTVRVESCHVRRESLLEECCSTF
jgi:hypothetical protein